MKEKNVGETVNDWLEYAKKRDVQVFPVPYMALLNQIGQKLGIDQMSKITRMINVLTIGVSFALFKYDRALAEKAVRATFADKGKIADMNVMAFNHAYDYAEQTFKDNFKHRLEKTRQSTRNAFSSPETKPSPWAKSWADAEYKHTTPSHPQLTKANTLKPTKSSKPAGEDEAIIVIQTEDEIAAINSASGAALAGARAATSTSGPGFSLMVEGLSWAGNSEVPVVVTYYQRGAPATGLTHSTWTSRPAVCNACGARRIPTNNPRVRRHQRMLLRRRQSV